MAYWGVLLLRPFMLTRLELIRQILSEALAPLVQAEGGELYLQSLGEREVSLHLTGRYSGSPAASLVCQELALPLIESVAPGTEVRWTTGKLVPVGSERVAPIADSSGASESAS